MRVFTPLEIARHAANKYLGVLVAAKYARVLNEFPRDRSASVPSWICGQNVCKCTCPTWANGTVWPVPGESPIVGG